jgi:catechol 2,3-dioxygenase-like lactoylglutathione lyase family enzyme
MPQTQSKTNITNVGTVMVPVSDQDKAIEFYTEKLGFELLADTPFGDGMRWVEVVPAGGSATDTVVALTPPREGKEDQIGQELGLGFTTSDVDADHAALKERGVDVDEEVMRMGDSVPPMFWFRDQDGNSIIIVQRHES